MIKIVVDAMGGDKAPDVIIHGVLAALSEFNNFNVILVGNLNKLKPFIDEFNLDNNLNIILEHAEHVINMHDQSFLAIRDKKNSSITVSVNMIKQKQADALITIGHTGAMVIASTVKLRMLPGVDRPAIAVLLPSCEGNVVLIDAGASVNCTSLNLAQFAVMGEIYYKSLFGVNDPKIGLLNIGNEDIKGHIEIKDSFKELSKLPIKFIGNIEGNDIFNHKADVIVCDGFIGNILLKTIEGVSSFAMNLVRDAFSKNIFRKIIGIFAKKIFRKFDLISDIERYGGAPLLGVNGICIKGHGKSSIRAVKYAIKTVLELKNNNINQLIINKLVDLNLMKKNF